MFFDSSYPSCGRLSRPQTTTPFPPPSEVIGFLESVCPSPIFHQPWHSLEGFPCSSSKTQAKCCRWRVSGRPVRSLRFPSVDTGYVRFTCITFMRESRVVRIRSLFLRMFFSFRFHWLTFQARYVRVRFPVGATLRVTHLGISQPSTTSWRLASSSWRLLGHVSHHAGWPASLMSKGS